MVTYKTIILVISIFVQQNFPGLRFIVAHLYVFLTFYRIELYHLQESTLAEKKKIRKVLKDFESQFLLEHNR